MILLLTLLALFMAIGIGVCWGYSQRVEHAVESRTESLLGEAEDARKAAAEAEEREATAEALLNKVIKKK